MGDEVGGETWSIFWNFQPYLGKWFPIWRAYFSNGLVQPPTSHSLETSRTFCWYFCWSLTLEILERIGKYNHRSKVWKELVGSFFKATSTGQVVFPTWVSMSVYVFASCEVLCWEPAHPLPGTYLEDDFPVPDSRPCFFVISSQKLVRTQKTKHVPFPCFKRDTCFMW